MCQGFSPKNCYRTSCCREILPRRTTCLRVRLAAKSKSALAAAHNSIAIQETAGATPSVYREKHSRKCDNHLIDAYVRIVLRRLPASMLRRVCDMPVLDW